MAEASDEISGLEWRRGRVIPFREFTFRQDPAGGPGGQHANRSATRVTLTWRPLTSESLREHEKLRLGEEWEARLTATGILRIRSGDERSARQNRERCLENLRDLLKSALAPRRTRRKTRPTLASKERRLTEKRQKSRRKDLRRRPGGED